MIPDALAGRLTRVATLDDDRLDDYRDLRDRDLRAARGAFIAESAGVLRVLCAQKRYPLRSVLLAESRVAPLAEVVAPLPWEVPIYVAEQALLNAIVGFSIHRGVLASAARPPLPEPAALLAELGAGPQRIVICEALTNHDNVGAVFRNAAAFGAAAVLLDGATCDPLYRKAIRVSVGGALLVPFARAASSAELVAAARAAGYAIVALTPHPSARDLRDLRRAPARLALLLGTEGTGLRAETMAGCDERVRIDFDPVIDSLNVATACGIALHAVRAAQRAAQRAGGGA